MAKSSNHAHQRAKQLSMANAEHRKYLQDQMDKFLSGADFDRAEGYVPSE